MYFFSLAFMCRLKKNIASRHRAYINRIMFSNVRYSTLPIPVYDSVANKLRKNYYWMISIANCSAKMRKAGAKKPTNFMKLM